MPLRGAGAPSMLDTISKILRTMLCTECQERGSEQSHSAAESSMAIRSSFLSHH